MLVVKNNAAVDAGLWRSWAAPGRMVTDNPE